MMVIINILSIFFIFLIMYQLILANYTREGLTTQYQPYDTNNPNNALILAQQNAGNISSLKQELDQLSGIQQTVNDLSGNITNLQTQVNGIVLSQQSYASQVSSPNITGAVDDTTTSSVTNSATTGVNSATTGVNSATTGVNSGVTTGVNSATSGISSATNGISSAASF